MNKRIAEFIAELCDENERLEKHNSFISEVRDIAVRENKTLATALKAAKAEIRRLKKERK